MNFHLKSTDDTLIDVSSNISGLSQDTATRRLQQYGENTLKPPTKDSLFTQFLRQLVDPMIIVLILAAILSGAVSIYAGESFTDTFIILFVIIINAFLGLYQENKAEKAIEALRKMSSSSSKVMRDGTLLTVKSSELTIGDVILLETGDVIPADARIIESASLKIQEAALTGESEAASKFTQALVSHDGVDVPLGDRKNMAYMGSSVVYGRGKAVVVAIAMATEIGKIAGALEDTKESDTPLQKRLHHLSRILSISVLLICVFMFTFSLIRAQSITANLILNSFMLSVSLAVAAIPEGLATVVTIQLAIGVTNMAKHNAIIRRMTAVETLGCTQVICSDKTGTLTQNKMTVTETFSFCKDETLLTCSLLMCNDAKISPNGESGDPTETALLRYAIDNLGDRLNSVSLHRVNEIPFDSERKMMSTFHQKPDGGFVQYTKGALDVVLALCSYALVDGQVKDLTDDLRKTILHQNTLMSGNALRVLSAAFKEYDALPPSPSALTSESELVFIGIAGMIDPIREEALLAISECKLAGILPVMITGDYKDTAIAIGRELSILSSEREAISGFELDAMDDHELQENVRKYSVYARVRPEHKTRIVNAWKNLGSVVAMTGDGVNDAPAIKSADIGLGMGITGTDVTKNAADMILADDNFATIVSAVREGRRIYANIKKAIEFLLSSNISEVLAIFFATVLGFTILAPIHILWINLITDTFPALALGMEPEEHDLMKKHPRLPCESIFANGLVGNIFYQGVVVAIITVFAYFLGHFAEFGNMNVSNSPLGTTMAFFTLSMCEIFHSFNVRSSTRSVFSSTKQNVYLLYSSIISFALVNILLLVPALLHIFELSPLLPNQYFVCLILASMVIPAVEVVKLVRRHYAKIIT